MTDKRIVDIAALIADRFAAELRKEITPEQFGQMVLLNSTDPDYFDPSLACASHNFCDANEPMARAFQSVVGRESEPASQDDADLWNMAWETARERHLGSPEWRVVGLAPEALRRLQAIAAYSAEATGRADDEALARMLGDLLPEQGTPLRMKDGAPDPEHIDELARGGK